MKAHVVLFLGLLLAGAVQSQKPQRKYPLVSITDLSKSSADTVRLKVYVLDIYICPPCPKGMQCKPCIENNFTVVEEKPIDIFKIPAENKLRIFTPHPDSVKLGRRYMLTVRFRNKKASPVDNMELISFQPL